MTRTEAKERLARVIREKQGCKATDLLGSEDVLEIIVSAQSAYTLLDLIEELVTERRIIEIEYCLAEIPYRIKSFLLPEGATIHVPDRKEASHVRSPR